MKRSVAFLIIFALVSLSGCGGEGDAMPPITSDIPNNVHILYNMDEIAPIEEAAIYYGTYIDSDASLLQGSLLRYPVVEEGVNAFGKYFYCTEKDDVIEILQLYDGGAEAGIYSGVNGGFSYSFWGNGQRGNYGQIVSMSTGHPDNIEQIYGYTTRADFKQGAELDFMGLEEASGLIEGIARDCHLPEMQLGTVYALDVETLRKHDEMRMENSSEAVDADWEKSDEAYLFFYEQAIDGIPLMNHIWDETIGRRLTTYMMVQVSKDGIFNIEMRNWVNLTGEEEKQTLIAPQEAEAILLETYSRSLQISEIYFEDLRLNYVGLVNGEDWMLVPAWVFCISKDFETEDIAGESVTVRQYEHYVVNAVTGEHIISPGGNGN